MRKKELADFKLALKQGRTQDALDMFSADLPINGHDSDFIDRTPIMIAIYENNKEAFHWLLEQDGIDIEKKEEGGYTALLYAMEQPQSAIADEFCIALINKGADLAATTNDDHNALTLAAQNGKSAAVKALLATGYDFSDDLSSSLFYAAQGIENETLAKPDLFDALIVAGADINYQSTFGSTALIAAASNGNYAAVKCLLDHGADHSIKGYEGTALDMSRYYYGKNEVTSLLEAYQNARHEFSVLSENIEFEDSPQTSGMTF